MIELLNLVSFILIISLIFFSKIFCFPKKILTTNTFENASINVVIFLNISLILSFFYYGFYFLIFIISVALIINLNKIKKLIFDTESIFLLILIFSISLQFISDPTLGWDGLRDWYSKAFNFFNNNSFIELNNYSFPHYPHLGTYVWAFFWKFNFLQLEYIGRVFFIFFYCLIIFTLVNQKKILI